MKKFNARALQLLMEKGKFIYIVSNKDFITEDVNPYFTELTGYSYEEIVGKNSIEVLDPEKVKIEVKHIMEELRDHGKFQINENPILTKDGRTKYILWYNVWDSKEERYISIGVDITNLREKEREIKERDEYILRLTSEAGAYIWRTLISEDGKEKTVYYTESVEKILGYPKEFFLQKEFVTPEDAPFRKVIHPDDLESFSKEIRKHLFKGKSVQGEIRLIKRNGDIIWVYEHLTPILINGKVKEVLGIAIDITEKKERELELERRNSELKFLLDSVNAYIFRVLMSKDGDYQVLYYSNGIEKVTGYKLEEFQRGEVSWEDIVYPPDREIHRKTVENKAIRGIPALVEYRIRRKDGKVIWVLDSISPMVKDENVIEVVGVCMDIDERKKAEEEKKNLEKLQTIGFISGSIAHLFNNILTGILGYTSLMKFRLPSSTGEYDILSRIESGIEKMVNINNKLLAYARLGKYKDEEIDIDIVIKNVIKNFEKTAQVKGIDIIAELTSHSCKIRGDKNQIEMVFRIVIEELLEKLTDSDLIYIKTRVLNITEDRLEKKVYIIPGKYVEITIRQNKITLGEKELENIFNPSSSYGIILSSDALSYPAVYGAIKSHGGFVYIESQKEGGTILTIYLPCLE